MPSELTESQNLAVHSRHSLTTVTAGAGSGKTRVLVERIANLVVELNDSSVSQSGIDRILAITFTDKAASEIRARLSMQFRDSNDIEAQRGLEGAYISTIHAFCARVLRDCPFDIGLDPNFKVLDPLTAKRLLRTSVSNVKNSLDGTKSADYEFLCSNLPSMIEGEISPSLILLQSIEKLISALRGSGQSLELMKEICDSGPDSLPGYVLSPLKNMISIVHNELAASTDMIKKAIYQYGKSIHSDLLELFQRSLNKIAGNENPEIVIPVFITLMKEANPVLHRLEREDKIDTQTITSNLFLWMNQAINVYSKKGESKRKSDDISWKLFRLTVNIWSEYTDRKEAAGILDQSDLEERCCELLVKSESVRRRYHRKFADILIDEFQDTSPVQMKIIQSLHMEGSESKNRLFIVGDLNQSIYAFRNARPALFESLIRSAQEGAQSTAIVLSENFRTTAPLLATVNMLFGQVWNNSDSRFSEQKALIHGSDTSSHSLELLVSMGTPRYHYVKDESIAMARRIQEIVKGQSIQIQPRGTERRTVARYGDIALLLRTLNEVHYYEEAFAENGIPFHVVGGGRGYYTRMEIRDLLNALTLVTNPEDVTALMAVLHSPFVGIDTNSVFKLVRRIKKKAHLKLSVELIDLCHESGISEENIEKINKLLHDLARVSNYEKRATVGSLLERLIVETKYDVKLAVRPEGRRRLANIRKLLQIAHEHPELSVTDFVSELKELELLTMGEGDAPIDEEDADVVRILTIHKSKGLEFPVVILGDLGRSIGTRESEPFVFDGMTPSIGTRIHGKTDEIYDLITSEKKKSDAEEALRVLYVAMTRAKDYLILCGDIQQNRNSLAHTLFPALGILELSSDTPQNITLLTGATARLSPISWYKNLNSST